MKLLSLLLLLFTIVCMTVCMTGCTPVTKMNKAKGEFLCRGSGGLYRIHQFSEYPIVCRNGSRFSVPALKSTIITDKDYLPQ